MQQFNFELYQPFSRAQMCLENMEYKWKHQLQDAEQKNQSCNNYITKGKKPKVMMEANDYLLRHKQSMQSQIQQHSNYDTIVVPFSQRQLSFPHTFYQKQPHEAQLSPELHNLNYQLHLRIKNNQNLFKTELVNRSNKKAKIARKVKGKLCSCCGKPNRKHKCQHNICGRKCQNINSELEKTKQIEEHNQNSAHLNHTQSQASEASAQIQPDSSKKALSIVITYQQANFGVKFSQIISKDSNASIDINLNRAETVKDNQVEQQNDKSVEQSKNTLQKKNKTFRTVDIVTSQKIVSTEGQLQPPKEKKSKKIINPKPSELQNNKQLKQTHSNNLQPQNEENFIGESDGFEQN